MRIKPLIALFIALTSLPVLAAWSIDPSQSSLNFVTTKNAQVSEVQSFDSLSGTVDDSGKLMLSVPLSSVNTAIPIRDTRMQEMLFQVAQFPTATYSAMIPESLLNLKPGSSETTVISGEISLHGITAPLAFKVVVSKVAENKLVVSTVAPSLISAATFGLEAGIEALRAIAGLKSITSTVPVTFAVTFSK